MRRRPPSDHGGDRQPGGRHRPARRWRTRCRGGATRALPPRSSHGATTPQCPDRLSPRPDPHHQVRPLPFLPALSAPRRRAPPHGPTPRRGWGGSGLLRHPRERHRTRISPVLSSCARLHQLCSVGCALSVMASVVGFVARCRAVLVRQRSRVIHAIQPGEDSLGHPSSWVAVGEGERGFAMACCGNDCDVAAGDDRSWRQVLKASAHGAPA